MFRTDVYHAGDDDDVVFISSYFSGTSHVVTTQARQEKNLWMQENTYKTKQAQNYRCARGTALMSRGTPSRATCNQLTRSVVALPSPKCPRRASRRQPAFSQYATTALTAAMAFSAAFSCRFSATFFSAADLSPNGGDSSALGTADHELGGGGDSHLLPALVI